MLQSHKLSEKKEELPPIVQRKNGASLTKPGYDDPVKEKPSPSDKSLTSQKAPIQRYLNIGADNDKKNQLTFKKPLLRKTKKELKDDYNASDEAVKLLDSIASNKRENLTFSDWDEAVEWANGYTDPVEALDYLDEEDQLDVEEDDQIKKKIKPGYTINSSEFIEMPKKKTGEVGENLVKEWLIKNLKVKPIMQQNKSGHGLDIVFEIKQKDILKLKNELASIFSPLKSSFDINDPNKLFTVMLEVKANSGKMSKAQKDPYNYVYRQSKKDFSVTIKDILEKKNEELYYEVNVDLTDRTKSDVDLSFNLNENRTRKKGQEQAGRFSDDFTYKPKKQLSYISSKEIGDIGEKWTREQLALHGYTKITSLQKESGQGVDIVGLDRQEKFNFFEVKTHTGSGKKPVLTKREKQQVDFVSDIVKNIKYGKNGYKKVNEDAINLVDEIYKKADSKKKKSKSKSKSNEDGDEDDSVKEFLKQEARYFVVNVDLPKLGEIDQISGEFLNWNPPKDLSGSKRKRPEIIEEKVNKQSPKTKKAKR